MKTKLEKLKSTNNLYTEENLRKNFHFPIINPQNSTKYVNLDFKKKNLKYANENNILKTQIFDFEKSPRIKNFHNNNFTENNYEETHKNFSTNKTILKRKIPNNSKVKLGNLLNNLIDIKHKIRKINFRNTTKINFNSNINNNADSNNINHVTERTNSKLNLNTFYNSPIHIKKKCLESNKNIFNNKNKAKSVKKQKINVKLNSKKNVLNNNYISIFEEHKKFQRNLKNFKMINFLMKYKKTIQRNREEEILHYKKSVLPEKTIEKLIELRNNLTLQKFKNEYYEKIINP